MLTVFTLINSSCAISETERPTASFAENLKFALRKRCVQGLIGRPIKDGDQLTQGRTGAGTSSQYRVNGAHEFLEVPGPSPNTQTHRRAAY